jgi:hypothetical protein
MMAHLGHHTRSFRWRSRADYRAILCLLRRKISGFASLVLFGASPAREARRPVVSLGSEYPSAPSNQRDLVEVGHTVAV